MYKIRGDEMVNVQKNPQFNQFSRMKIRQENLKNNTINYIRWLMALVVRCSIGFCILYL